MTTQLALFDYAALDTETRIVVQQRTTEIRALMKRAASDIIEIGQKLKEVQHILGYGLFEGWLKAEFEWSRRTAYNFIGVADQFGCANFAQLNIAASALYLLSAPSIPESARIEALARAEEGEAITHALARDIVSDHRAPSIPFVPEEENGRPHVEWNNPIAVAEQEFSEDTQAYTEDRASTMKPKINRAGDIYEPQGFDACQTPGYAIDPLLPYLPMEWSIWEPACGEGALVEALYDASRNVVGTDILIGENFFTSGGPIGWDCLVTNPPYSIKYPWLARCYELGKPFALLLPVETLGAKTAQELFTEFGLEIILLDQRINFKMPLKGWDGNGAQFPVAWFTWGLEIGQQITFAKVRRDRVY